MELTVEEALQSGVAAHKEGKLKEAENFYRAILKAQHSHPDANHNLGIIAVSVNQPEAALPLLKTALEANPNKTQYWVSFVDALIKADQSENARRIIKQGQDRGLPDEVFRDLVVRLRTDSSEPRDDQSESDRFAGIVELREAGKFQKAKDELEKFIESNPEDPEAISLLSQLLLLNNETPEAEEKIVKAASINPELPSVLRNYARLLLKQARPEEALRKAQRAYEKSTDDLESGVVLAACLGASQRDEEALPLIEKAIERRPDYAEAIANRALIRLRRGEIAGAIADAELVVSIKPHLAQIWWLLGSLRYQSKDLPGAIEALENAHSHEPKNVEYLVTLGNFLRQEDKTDESIVYLEKAVEMAPNNANAWSNLGAALYEKKRVGEAKAAFEKSLALDPDSAEVSSNLGALAKDIGDLEGALRHFEKALSIKPDLIGVLNNMGVTLRQMGNLQEAEKYYRRAIELSPESAMTYSNLGSTLRYMNRLVDALEYYDKALELDSNLASALQGKAHVLALLANYKDVVTLHNKCLDNVDRHMLSRNWEGRLYNWIYHPDLSPEEICEEHKKWGSQYASLGQENFPDHDRAPIRRLRVGYVSPDFRGHTCRFYYEPLFSSHNSEKIELFAYSSVLHADEHTTRLKSYFDGWRDIRRISDKEAAEVIRKDKIDILVDGCGHMKDTRLGIFTLKPAPIQVTWLGAAWTTGLPQMDYVLFDRYMAPEGTAASERIVHLPGTWAAFRPSEKAKQSEIKPLPALRNGHITFGYTGRSERLNYKVFSVWGRILKELPQAILVLDYKSFVNSRNQAYFISLMEKSGVDISRVVMRNSVDIFDGLGSIDILLDSFPHSGGTMLFDALWMGIPAVTLATSRPVGRIGTSLMNNLGLPEWVGISEQEYIDKAVTFAQDTSKLSELRRSLRKRMEASPVMDELSFAKGVEEAYQNMWQKWIAEN